MCEDTERWEKAGLEEENKRLRKSLVAKTQRLECLDDFRKKLEDIARELQIIGAHGEITNYQISMYKSMASLLYDIYYKNDSLTLLDYGLDWSDYRDIESWIW